MKKKITLFSIAMLLGILIISTGNVNAAEDIIPTASNNIQISLRSRSSLVSLDSGYMRVFYDDVNENIGVEYYDDNFNILSKDKIELELSLWGGFYAGEDAYYIVEGENNTDEDDSAEVIRVIKYDKNWKRLGASNITGDGSSMYRKIRYPFDYGCVEMTEVDGNLYIVTGHEGYIDSSVGQGHQGYLMIQVDESTLTAKIVDADLWHSFAQYIDNDDSYLYVLEQSEGSRQAQITRYDKETLKNSTIPILSYGGSRTSAWAIPCYASVNGISLSEKNILTVGTSIDQSLYDDVTSSVAHNIYLTVTPKDDFSSSATNVIWLTDYADNGQSFVGLEITKINNNRFMISWEEYKESQAVTDNDTLSTSVLHYIFIDGDGNVVSSEYTAAATISDCQPIVKGDKIVYYASNENMLDFYIIDSNTGSFSKVMYRIAGENATWELSDDGILTISGTGDISIDTEARFRGPLSSTSSGATYSSADNAWKAVRTLVKEIVIEEGITSVPDKEFKSFSSLTSVTLPSSMETIGDQAFAYCDYLRKVVILENVTSIGTDAFWSGWYSSFTDEKIIYVTIYTTEGSYAATWAEENNVSYEYIEIPVTKITLNKTALTLKKGNTSTLSATITPTNATDTTVTWTSSDTKIASVSEDGTVTAKSNGTVTITATTSNGLTATCTIIVGDYLLGDMNANGEIDLADILVFLKVYFGRLATTDYYQQVGDMNYNGEIDLKDLVLLMKTYFNC